MRATVAPRRTMQQHWQRWLSRRIPRQREVVLDQRRIFIFPSRAGLWFLAALTVMSLAAINYQNNLAFALVFWLLGLMVVSILHAYMNLSGLRLTALRGHPGFAGESIRFDLQLSCRGKRPRRALIAAWPDGDSVSLAQLRGRAELALHYPASRRGWLRPPRLRLESSYPLGLITAWTWVDLDWAALVYPRPLAVALPAPASRSAAESRKLRLAAAGEEFHGIRDYQAGDSLRRMLWKSYARGGRLQTLQLAEPVDQRLWLDYRDLNGDPELRLQRLCHWVLELSRRDRSFGLRLPGHSIDPARGAQHRQRSLEALALFEVGSATGG